MKPLDKLFPYLLLAGILINANGLLNDILEPDGALYATVAKQMAISGDWLNLFAQGHDWLDKPHFPFWVTAASFKLLGISAFGYKLPAFLFWLTGIWYTFRLATAFYDAFTGRVAVLVYVFALHSVLNNFDVRAEPYLTTLIIAATWHFYKANVSGKWQQVVLAAMAIAAAVMTKGIFVLITIGGGFVIYWAVTSQWKQFINAKWWLMLLLVLLFISPELYSLYNQFDLHPEKVVFGKTGVSGLQFFVWDSQFGRFFNTGPIKGRGDISFFLHTTLWAFLPWSVILYIALFQLFARRSKYESRQWIIYGSASVTFLLFSFSKFQLPHYIVILFPHFAIITAAYLTNISQAVTFKRLAIFQNALLVTAAVFVCLLCWFSRFGNLAAVIIISFVITTAALLYKKEASLKVMIPGIAFSLVLFAFLHNFFYPHLLKYQSGMMAGKWLTATQPGKNAGIMGEWMSYSFEFYSPGLARRLETTEQLNQFLEIDSTRAICTTYPVLNELKRQGYSINILKEFPHFHISLITAKFLNPATRQEELEKIVLAKVSRGKG